MIIKPNKFLTISFFLAGRSQELNAVLMGGEVSWKAAAVAHRMGLHLPLERCVRDTSLVLANVVKAVSISQLPCQFGSSQATSVRVDTLSLACGSEPERLGLAVPQGWEMKSSCNGHSRAFGLLSVR